MLSRSSCSLLSKSVRAVLTGYVRNVSLQPSLNNSRQAIKRQLELFMHESKTATAGALPTYNVTDLLGSVMRLGDPVMTRSVIKEYVNVESLSIEDFTLSLNCYRSVRDNASALMLYKEAQQRNKSLTNTQTLQLVLSMVRFTPALVNTGIDLYRSALKDPAQFPHLKSDSITAKAAIALYLNAPLDTGHTLHDAILIKSMLQKEGVQMDPAVYSTLLAVAAKHRDFSTARELYAESQAAGITSNISIESAMLHAAVRAGARKESMEIFTRIRSADHLGLTEAVVESMLESCLESGDASLCAKLVNQWLRGGGALTWPMCHAVAQLLVTPDVLKMVSDYDSGSIAMPMRSTKAGAPAAADNAVVATGESIKLDIAPQPEAPKLTAKELHEQRGCVKLVRIVLSRTVDALHAFLKRSGAEQKVGGHATGRALKNGDELASIPLYVLPSLGALLALRGESDALFIRLDSLTGVRTGKRHRADHQRVVLTMARDLALLGKWRHLMALHSRVAMYQHNDDTLMYPQDILQVVRHYMALGMIRGGEFERANRHIDANMSPYSPAVAEALRGALDGHVPGGSALFAPELEYINGRFSVSAGRPSAL